MGILRGLAIFWAAASSLLLGGCVAVDGRFDLGVDERISIDLTLELDWAAAVNRYDGDACVILEQAWPWVDQARLEPGTGQDTVSCRLTAAIESALLAPDAAPSYRKQVTGLTVDHRDGAYHFRWDPGYFNGEAAAATDSFRVEVRFPGEVRSHSGSSSVAGTTVTWTSMADLMGDGGLVAAGDDRPGLLTLARDYPVIWAVIGLLGLGFGVGILRTRRAERSAPTPAPAPGGPPVTVTEAAVPAERSHQAEPVPVAAITGPGVWAPTASDVSGPRPAPAPPPVRRTPSADADSPWAPPG